LLLAALVNGASQIAITKIDVRFPGNGGVRKYNDLTKEAKAFIEATQKKIGVPITLIGTGPDSSDIIDRR
jgi:adenylosuccinate synthase